MSEDTVVISVDSLGDWRTPAELAYPTEGMEDQYPTPVGPTPLHAPSIEARVADILAYPDQHRHRTLEDYEACVSLGRRGFRYPELVEAHRRLLRGPMFRTPLL